MKEERVELPSGGEETNHFAMRQDRSRRMTWAWGSSLVSKAVTITVQIMAVPLAYRALGQSGYAAYAAVTACAGLIAILNLGIGGSLVTPIADAAALGDKHQQARLVQAGLGPLIALLLAGSALVVPIVGFLPLRMLFGRIGVTGGTDLRIAAIIAVSATLCSIPLHSCAFLRQAYQELHYNNLIGAASNLLLCVCLLIAARRSGSVAVFVAVFVLIPLGSNIFNLAWLFVQRPFLLYGIGRVPWDESRRLLGDGIRFLGAAFASVLLYQWPVYWVARSLPASTSSQFAVCIQATILPLGFVFGLLLPLWSSAADALARCDWKWLDENTRRWRTAAVLTGLCGLAVTLIFGQDILRLWLHSSIRLPWPVRALIGAYILLAIWEQFHFTMGLGFGRLREASAAQFQRAFGFAIAVPLLARFGGVPALWFGMCCSILLWSSWRLPPLMRPPERSVSRRHTETNLDAGQHNPALADLARLHLSPAASLPSGIC